ncbi:MAG TPA: hypothetical protein VFK47_17115 [Ktedonobacteraceae bacterium]|nr:hypothetical protein [Ktedonobacteraceae bacterium]
MKKMIIKNSLVATIAAFSFATAMPVMASAQGVAQERETAQTTAAEKREAAQTRLANAKLKACQNREKAITNIMTRIGDRGQKQVDLFTKIADKTQAFYTNKGKKLSNYDTLVSDVTAKKQAAQTAVDATKASVIEFKCDGSDPKGAAASFKENMKTQNTALKAYKTAVKNLIVGVKSVQGSTASAENNAGGNQ